MLGSVTTYSGGDVKSIVLLDSVTATNGAPSGTVGLDMRSVFDLFGYMPEEVSLIVYSTAGSGTMTCTARLWGAHPSPMRWFPLGTGTDAAKGTINAGSALGETGTNEIRHCEVLSLAGIAGSHLYLEITAIGGTATAVMAELVVRRGYPR